MLQTSEKEYPKDYSIKSVSATEFDDSNPSIAGYIQTYQSHKTT